MHFTLTQITQYLIDYKYILLFPIAVIEGPIITVLAGFLISMSNLNFFIAYPVIVIGDLTGDCLYYAIGRFGKETFIKRWGKYIGINQERVLSMENHFNGHSGKTLLTGKLTHGLGAFFLVAAGIAKMPFGKYFWYNLLATLPKSLILLIIGYYFGFSITKINNALDFLATFFIGLAVVLFLGYLIFKRNKEQ